MASFKPSKKLIFSLTLIVFVVVASVLVYTFILRSNGVCGTDQRQIEYSVSYLEQNNTLLLDIESWLNQSFVFDKVVVKGLGGQVLVNSDISPTELPPYKTTNVTVNLGNCVFSFGQGYRVELYTNKGDSYSSYLFLYEKVQTHVSMFTVNTISVYVQSFANQTVVLDRATIYKHATENTIQGQTKFPWDVTFSPQIDLQPNQNTTVTIPYKYGLTPGNYTIYLHSASPTYVIGTMANFEVTGTEDCFN